MRFMMKVVLDTETTNELVREGRMGELIGEILADQQPEAAYFTAEYGQRTAILFVNYDDPSELPRLAEPWFLAFNATIEVQPAMTAEDVEKAGPFIEDAAKRFA